jgi:hypothetical protein
LHGLEQFLEDSHKTMPQVFPPDKPELPPHTVVARGTPIARLLEAACRPFDEASVVVTMESIRGTEHC